MAGLAVCACHIRGGAHEDACRVIGVEEEAAVRAAAAAAAGGAVAPLLLLVVPPLLQLVLLLEEGRVLRTSFCSGTIERTRICSAVATPRLSLN